MWTNVKKKSPISFLFFKTPGFLEKIVKSWSAIRIGMAMETNIFKKNSGFGKRQNLSRIDFGPEKTSWRTILECESRQNGKRGGKLWIGQTARETLELANGDDGQSGEIPIQNPLQSSRISLSRRGKMGKRPTKLVRLGPGRAKNLSRACKTGDFCPLDKFLQTRAFPSFWR